MSQTHEQTINIALGAILEKLGKQWQVETERNRVFSDGSGRPDVLLVNESNWPVVIEAEIGNKPSAEKDAISRLGRTIVGNSNPIESAVALVYPTALKAAGNQNLDQALRKITLEYALFTLGPDKSPHRTPSNGFLSGSIVDLVLLLHRAGVATWRVAELTEALENGIVGAAGTLNTLHPIKGGTPLGAALVKALGQDDDTSGQTRKMALAVIVNALVFHDTLAGVGLKVPTLHSSKSKRAVLGVDTFRKHGIFQPTGITDEWDRILEVNYWPIFFTAKAVLSALPLKTRAIILAELWEVTELLIAAGVTKSHDMTGVIFQRLIADRKVLATFYTRPACATLLAGLAMPTICTGIDWGDRSALRRMRIADFACGTGTLLSSAYHRLSALHDVHGGDSEVLHPHLMKDGLVGLDVLAVAVHLTAAMLAGTHPRIPFEGECLLTMPYGVEKGKAVFLGSLALLEKEEEGLPLLFEGAAETAGGSGKKRVEQLQATIQPRSFDIVIMNPPFTRATNHEGGHEEVHNPAFAAFNATADEQTLLSDELKKIARGSCASGNAGLASYFVELADRMVKTHGRIALVLPLSAMSGSSWQPVRSLWRSKYSGIVIVTIAGAESEARSFSADTGMAECLVLARKISEGTAADRRASFVSLNTRPENLLEGDLIASAINRALEASPVTLEGGPHGGTPVCLGNKEIGHLLDAPISEDGVWPLVGISDIALAQTAFQLTTGRLWVAGHDQVIIPVTTFDKLITRTAPVHRDISGEELDSNKVPRGPFSIVDGCSPTDDYPCLWAHDASLERQLIVMPDTHGRVRSQAAHKVASIWNTATNLHYNSDFQFNSQPLIAAFTERKSIGGRAWPSLILKNMDAQYACALWCNSTLGLLSHWWVANKSQAGRGTLTVTSIPSVTTLNLAKLTPAQNKKAKAAFDKLATKSLKPFHQLNTDASRAAIDHAILVDVLGLPKSLLDSDGPIDRLRHKLAAEPQIHGGRSL